jgi:RNA polymerase sigma-70 factor (ECF subfamily)
MGSKNYRRRIELFSGNVPTTGGESDSLEEERLGRIYAAIHLLKPMDRSLMLMALDGLSYREMAEVLGLTESNIGVKINRIKTQLIETLKGDEYELR